MPSPTIYLYGPPGSGKTTLGRRLASTLEREFVDTDEWIEARAGKSVADIFTDEGEARFRAWESEALRAVSSAPGRVVALGGGALLDLANRERVEKHGVVVRLDCHEDEIARRLEAGAAARPLLAGPNGRERRAKLLAERAAHYRSFPLAVDTSDLSPEDALEALQRRLGRTRVKGMRRGYDVIVRRGAWASLGAEMAALGLNPPIVVVTDEDVARNAGRTMDFLAPTIAIPAGEASKNLGTAARLYGELIAAGFERGGTLVAVGGGVVGDVAGFVAATIFRGVRWVNVPTSLLAMADASLGGKVGVDLPEGKNLVGAFHPPSLVVSDPEVLRTLPEGERTSGMAEVVKASVVGDARLFEIVESGDLDTPEVFDEALFRAIRVKCRVVEADPFERGERASLNFGHTLGHAVEHLSGYRIRHGEAVAMGMVAETRLAEAIGLCQPGLAERLAAALARWRLPTRMPEMAPHAVRALMVRDKKTLGGRPRFALPEAIGRVRVGVEVPDEVVTGVLQTSEVFKTSDVREAEGAR